jgi:hypothetical protein
MKAAMSSLSDRESIVMHLLSGIATAIGVAACYFLTSKLPYMISVLVCAVTIAFFTTASTRIAHPSFWWASLGIIAGSITGTSFALNESFSELGLTSKELWRHTVIGTLIVGGLVSGIVLGRNVDEKVNIVKPMDFLKNASGLTAGMFAVLVSFKFTNEGLEAAHTLSSRLSCVTTVLVTTLVLPGWIGFQLCRLIVSKGK